MLALVNKRIHEGKPLQFSILPIANLNVVQGAEPESIISWLFEGGVGPHTRTIYRNAVVWFEALASSPASSSSLYWPSHYVVGTYNVEIVIEEANGNTISATTVVTVTAP